MKSKKYMMLLLVAMLSTSMLSCKKEVPDESNTPRHISITISGLSSAVGKSAPTDPVDPVNDQTTANISSVDIYVTDASGVILRSGGFSTGTTAWTNLTSVGHKFINVQPSASKVYVFGNLGASSLAALGTNISAVDLTKTLLQQQGMASILYVGHDDSMVPAEGPLPPSATTGTTFKAEVTLTPITSRFQIKSITFEADGSTTYTKTISGVPSSTTVSWTGFNADLIGIYLNNFYYTNNNRILGQLMSNTTGGSSLITQGKWLFGSDDYAIVASYNKYNHTTFVYEPMVMPQTNSKCYAFNFFPENIGAAIPKIHFLLTNMTKTTLLSGDPDIYNPSLFPDPSATAYVNVIRYFKLPGGTLMTASDFKANMIYNLDVVISPPLAQTDLQQIQYNVLVTVTVLPWTVENLAPGFETN